MCKAADDDQPNNHSNTNINANILPNNCVNLRCCCAVSPYCVCFSIIKPCSYWNSGTLDSISDHANIFYTQKFNINKQCLTMNDYPKCLQIYDADIHITFHFQNQGRFCCTSDTSKLEVEKLIINSINGSTGFIAWLSSVCVCCIFHQLYKITHFYLMVINVNGDFDIFEKLNSIPCLILRQKHLNAMMLNWISLFVICEIRF